MVNTLTSYQLITRDIARSIERVENQPMAARETEYYLENISNVKTIKEFVDDPRLFNYAMKAHGLSDMAYAKAFMVKVLEEGIDDPNSFANKLTDKRYAEFAKSFNFAAYGADATSFNPAQNRTIELYALASTVDGVPIDTQRDEIRYYLDNIVKVRSVDQLLADDRLLDFVLHAYDLEAHAGDKAFVRQLLEGGTDPNDSFAARRGDERHLAFVNSFNFAAFGEETTTRVAAQQPAIDKFMRQSLEEQAGLDNEGVRLALYFERKAQAGISTWYEVLADPALAEVVRVALGLPDSFAQADIDKQAAHFGDRLDIADFADPESLGKFITRFTALWEMNNPSGPALSAASILIGQPIEFGISTDVMLTLARMKR